MQVERIAAFAERSALLLRVADRRVRRKIEREGRRIMQTFNKGELLDSMQLETMEDAIKKFQEALTNPIVDEIRVKKYGRDDSIPEFAKIRKDANK